MPDRQSNKVILHTFGDSSQQFLAIYPEKQPINSPFMHTVSYGWRDIRTNISTYKVAPLLELFNKCQKERI